MNCDGAAARKEVRQHLVVPGLRQRHVDRPRAVRLLLRMDVLEVLHVLADDEQVILPLVHHLELRDRLAGARMEDAEAPASPSGPACTTAGSVVKIEPVVAHVERRARTSAMPQRGHLPAMSSV